MGGLQPIPRDSKDNIMEAMFDDKNKMSHVMSSNMAVSGRVSVE